MENEDVELVGSPWGASEEESELEGGRCSNKGLEHMGEQSDLSAIRDRLVEGEVSVGV